MFTITNKEVLDANTVRFTNPDCGMTLTLDKTEWTIDVLCGDGINHKSGLAPEDQSTFETEEIVFNRVIAEIQADIIRFNERTE